MKENKLSKMSSSDIKEAVKDKYSQVAKDPCGSFNFPVGKTFAIDVGYPKEILDKLPEDIINNINDLFRCIGRALPEKDFLSLMEKTGFQNTKVISKIRNARTGHKLAICVNIRSYKI